MLLIEATLIKVKNVSWKQNIDNNSELLLDNTIVILIKQQVEKILSIKWKFQIRSIVSTPSTVDIIKHFSLRLMLWKSKLECLYHTSRILLCIKTRHLYSQVVNWLETSLRETL